MVENRRQPSRRRSDTAYTDRPSTRAAGQYLERRRASCFLQARSTDATPTGAAALVVIERDFDAVPRAQRTSSASLRAWLVPVRAAEAAALRDRCRLGVGPCGHVGEVIESVLRRVAGSRVGLEGGPATGTPPVFSDPLVRHGDRRGVWGTTWATACETASRADGAHDGRGGAHSQYPTTSCALHSSRGASQSGQKASSRPRVCGTRRWQAGQRRCVMAVVSHSQGDTSAR
jgi:hypothetical protein